MSPRNGDFPPKPGERGFSPLSLNTVKVKHQVPPDPFEQPRQTNHEKSIHSD